MAKTRKTRQQKMILQLKRELNQAQVSEPRQEAKVFSSPLPEKKTEHQKNADESVFLYNPSLITKDLWRSLAFMIIVFTLELVLYLKLR